MATIDAQDGERALRLLGELLDEELVDLDLVEVEAAEVAQRRIAGAEIVERDADADVAQLVERHRHRRSLSCSSTVSVTSSSSDCGSRCEPPSALMHGLAHVAEAELRRRQVDRDLDPLRPFHGIEARLPQRPLADRHDEAGLLGERDEVGRARSRPRSGWFQRNSASKPVISPRSRLSCGW